jgi:hypothetical protein
MTKRRIGVTRANSRDSVSIRVIDVMRHFGWMNKDAIADAVGCAKSSCWKLVTAMVDAKILARRKGTGSSNEYHLQSPGLKLPQKERRCRQYRPRKVVKKLNTKPLFGPYLHMDARELGNALGCLGYLPQSTFTPTHREHHVVTE